MAELTPRMPRSLLDLLPPPPGTRKRDTATAGAVAPVLSSVTVPGHRRRGGADRSHGGCRDRARAVCRCGEPAHGARGCHRIHAEHVPHGASGGLCLPAPARRPGVRGRRRRNGGGPPRRPRGCPRTGRTRLRRRSEYPGDRPVHSRLPRSTVTCSDMSSVVRQARSQPRCHEPARDYLTRKRHEGASGTRSTAPPRRSNPPRTWPSYVPVTAF